MAENLSPEAMWFDRAWEELRGYNFEWVAATKEELVAHAANLELVMDAVIGRELQAQAVYLFVDFPQELEETQ